MMAFAIQAGGLLFVAFVAGCVGGCWARRSFQKAPPG